MSDKAVPFFYDSAREVVIELSDNMTFGRNKECDYSVVDHRVSGVHFKVSIKNDDVYIIDLESSNSTKLNGTEVCPNTEMKLSLKDKVKFGEQQFSYFFEPLDNFFHPDITETLTISNTADIVDEMLSPASDFDRGMNLSLGSNQKKGSQLSDLKKSKALVSQYEESLKKVIDDIATREAISKEYDNLMIKISNSKQELKNACYEDRSKIAEDVKSFNFSISELHSSIEQAQEKINSWKKDIEVIQNKVEEVQRLELIHQCLESDQEAESGLSSKLSSYREKNLDELKSDVQNKLKKEFSNYKTIQEEYSDRLKYKKSRLAS